MEKGFRGSGSSCSNRGPEAIPLRIRKFLEHCELTNMGYVREEKQHEDEVEDENEDENDDEDEDEDDDDEEEEGRKEGRKEGTESVCSRHRDDSKYIQATFTSQIERNGETVLSYGEIGSNVNEGSKL
ncbi:hypothetical protein V1478_011894 [Vespula squamosa]|uniref:Uncharacterized protein n=1 Tax=Vespula squamosa TaxID=30214 RepID=A0ABD2ABN4_VESSQ